MSSTISWRLKGFNWFLIGSYTKKLKDVVQLITKQEMTHFEQFPKVQKDKTKNRGIFKKRVNEADDLIQMCL